MLKFLYIIFIISNFFFFLSFSLSIFSFCNAYLLFSFFLSYLFVCKHLIDLPICIIISFVHIILCILTDNSIHACTHSICMCPGIYLCVYIIQKTVYLPSLSLWVHIQVSDYFYTNQFCQLTYTSNGDTVGVILSS